MIGPKFDPKNGQIYVHNFVKFKRIQWRVKINVTNFRLQQRILITTIAIPIKRRGLISNTDCVKRKI